MRYRKRNKRILIFLGIVLCLMTAGYAAFYSELDITGTSNITNNWDIEITNVNVGTTTGNGENVNTPSWDALTASMEANVYESGDSVSYNVEVSNLGSLDAKLDEITKNIKTNNEAVKITFSGYTKGERLYRYGQAGSTKTIVVTVSYNDDYKGELNYNTSTETSVTFNYVQAEGSNTDPENPEPTTYLLTYDYEENGGTSSTKENEYFNSGTNITLGGSAEKEGYTFIGWNTDKDAETGLNSIILNENKTVYAIYRKTINITYQKEGNIITLSKANDVCNLYNKTASCEKTLPTVTLSDETNYSFDGWYKGNDKQTIENNKYTFTENTTLIAKVNALPVMKSWNSYIDTSNFNWKSNTPDFHNDSVRNTITEIEFVDLDDNNVTAPTPNNTTSWDVSAAGNNSVIAWLNGTKLYIGGKGGVIANSNSSNLFRLFSNVTTITFNNNFDTSKVTNMWAMFENMTSITSLDLSSFNTSEVTKMESMFSGCTNLISLNVSHFNTSKVTNTYGMFNRCNSLTQLDVSHFDTSNVTTMYGMFAGCTSLTSLNVSNFNTSKVTDMVYMFYNCLSLTGLDVSNFDTSNVTNMSHMFDNCTNLTTLDISGFNMNKVTNIYNWLVNDTKLATIDASNVIAPVDASNMFANLTGLTSINLTNFDTSNTTNMNSMFLNCSNLIELDVSSFDTSKVTNMESMFNGPDNLSSKLKKIIFGEHWNTSKVTNMRLMFADCTKLEELDLSNFNTSNVTNMEWMFVQLDSIFELNLTMFDTKKVENFYGMFQSSDNLKTIYVSNKFVTTAATNSTYMFSYATKLVGGNGTTYSSSHIDKEYARIDATNTPGYFTDGLEAKPTATKTTKSITVTANVPHSSGITSYQFSNDNGTTWTNSQVSENYQFTGLTNGQTYQIKVKTIDKDNGVHISKVLSVKTDDIAVPTYSQQDISAGTKIIINFNNECTGHGLTCSYKKNNNEWETVTTNTKEVEFTEGGSIIARVTDNVNTVTASTFTVKINPVMKSWNSYIDTSDFNWKSNTPDFHNDSVRNTITEIEFVDLDDNNVTAPTPNNTTSWDVSAAGNGSVIAWLNGTKLYIGGKGGVIANSNSSFLFCDFANLINIKFNNKLNTSNVTDMRNMFAYSNNLLSLDVSSFDTSKVTNMKYMFAGQKNSGMSQTKMLLEEIIGLTSFDTSNVTNMQAMFMNCGELTELDVSSFNTSKVTTMFNMFNGPNDGSSKLTTITFGENFNTSNVTDMGNMFCDNRKLESLDLSNFNTSKVTNMSSMFSYCTNLTSLNISDFDMSKVTDKTGWLAGDTKLATINASNAVAPVDASSMFAGLTGLTSINLTNFDTSNVTNMYDMFDNCSSLTQLDISSFNTSKVQNMINMFYRCSSLRTLDLSSFDTSKVTSMISMFSTCNNLTELNISSFNTSNVTNMQTMFWGCVSLTELDLSSFNTNKVTNMTSIFNECSNLETIYVSENFVTTAVNNSTGMFNNDINLVGGNGTTFNSSYIDKTRALIDKAGQVGYFTDGSIPIIDEVNTSSTTNSITVVVSARSLMSQITKYEYSIDGGQTWINNNTNNVYTFTNLTANTGYPIYVKVTNAQNKTAIYKTDDVDVKVPTNDLLFWGQADNPNNTSSILKNKVSGTDGTLNGFNGTTESGYNGNDLVFDGINDYVNIGLANYDFHNSQSIVMYVRIINIPDNNEHDLFANWSTSGSGINLNNGDLGYAVWDGQKYNKAAYEKNIINNDSYYTIVGTYDGEKVKLYLNNLLLSTVNSENLTTSAYNFLIGAYGNVYPTNMSLKEAMLYDRALTGAEVTSITNGFNEKYKANTKAVAVPTYSESYSGNTKNITITYPEGCGETYTCTYKKNDEAVHTVLTSELTNNTVTVPYTSAGNIIGTVSDGTNTVNSSYVVTYNKLYVKSNGNDNSGLGSISAPYSTIGKAYTMADSASTIYVMDDITQTATTTLNSNKNITLTSSNSSGNTGSNINNSIIRGSSFMNYLVHTTAGTLTLKDITFDGNNIEATNSLLLIQSTFIMNSGTILENNIETLNNGGGGGISISNSPSTTINGGIIRNNTAKNGGGGGLVSRNTNITINNIEISNNTTTSQGGGLLFGDSTLTINGGTISNNTASTSGGGIYSFFNATININGGTISNNTATGNGGGITSNNGILNITGGTISNNSAGNCGGGISSNATINMSDGTISGNTASVNSGGILVSGNVSKLTMNGGTIRENESRDIGAVHVYNGATFILDGGTIKDNVATNSSSTGGIYVTVASDSIAAGTYTYKSGTLSGNTPCSTANREAHRC